MIQEGSNPPTASYALASFETAAILQPTKKSPSALSLIPDPNRAANPRYNKTTSSSVPNSLMRKTRRQSTSSSPTASATTITHTQLTSSPVLFRAEPDSPISLYEWQRSINDRIQSPFPSEPPPSPPPPVPKVPYGTVNMYTSISSPPNRHTLPTSASHKSLSQSVSAAISSVTSPGSRRKSRVISPSEMKRVRDADAASMASSGSATPPPPPSVAVQQGFFETEMDHSLPNAEKALEQAMRFHQQRRNQARFGTKGSVNGSVRDSVTSSPVAAAAAATATASVTSNIRPIATLPAMKSSTAPDLSIASFEVLIKELEAEEEERKRKHSPIPPEEAVPLPPSFPANPTPPSIVSPAIELTSLPSVAIPRPNRPSAIHEAKRRSTGSILFNQLTPTFQSFDKENSYPFLLDRKPSVTSPSQSRRVSVASFGSQHSESKRNSSAREITFNFVDWSGIGGPRYSIQAEKRMSKEMYGKLGRSDSVVSSVLSEFDQSRRSSSYNYGRRGSVF